jgi:hypothetical protein
MKLKLPVLLFHQQQFKKYSALLHAVVNSSFGLVVEILNVCEVQVISTTMVNIWWLYFLRNM